MDRRVARTRALLQRAHLSLIVEKGYDATTVEAICERANVGRSTFYAHFTGKEDMHRRGLEGLRLELSARPPPQPGSGPAERGLQFSLPMFEHARAHLDLYRALTGSRGGVIAMESIRQVLCDVVRTELQRSDGGAGRPRPQEFVVQYLVGAYLAVLTWWLDAGAEASPREMDAMYQRLAREGLAGEACASPHPTRSAGHPPPPGERGP